MFTAIVCVCFVLRYNNKTYRIDDIDWDKNPMSTFTTRTGEISFMQYYENAYNKKISDKEQPLLVSMPKKIVSVVCACARVCVWHIIHPPVHLHAGPAPWDGWPHSAGP